ncbi:MAG: alpha/beta hydrolase, partial [Aureliella sp.]
QASLIAAPQMRTVIYAHGNWMTAENARSRGTYIYRRASQRAAEPVRFIIYSWPSQREGRPVRDVYEKVDRADMETVYFANLLTRIPAETPLGLMAFSFGARVACGGLHLVNGGQLEGRTGPVWDIERHLHVSLVAPAFDRTWLAAGRPYGLAMNGMHSLVNVYNSRDPALKRFRFIDRMTSPIAAGFTGLADPRATQPLQADVRIRQFDCGPDVGTSHDEMTYYEQCCAYNIALDNALGR